MKKFWFERKCSAHFGLMASGSGTYNAPKRDMEMITVPGRNGMLVVDNGRFENVTVKYPVSISKDFQKHAAAVRQWLLGSPGYRRLEDEYNPEYFRMAVFQGPLNFETGFLNRTGEATISFDCKPQRFLKTGERAVHFYEAALFRNPTDFPAQPLIKLTGLGPGSVGIGEVNVEILELIDGMILDCEMMNAYRVTESGAYENLNHCIQASDFPVLAAGENRISWDGDITAIEVTPRWWTV